MGKAPNTPLILFYKGINHQKQIHMRRMTAKPTFCEGGKEESTISARFE
jgi:hypothetical protein